MSSNGEYNPTPRIEEILNYAMAQIQSVPYRPSGRWVFYQVYQRYGLDKKKGAKLFDKWTSRARKASWNDWRPDIFSDSVRKADVWGRGDFDPEEALEKMKTKLFSFDKINTQEKYVEIWYEAAAMHEQFKHVTQGWYVTLVPFRGDASIPYKYEIAKRLENVAESYGKPIVILYFGDLDKKGLSIPESACRDIREWCGDATFEFIRCGLNKDQVGSLDIPENPEKPGTYQWEALGDTQATQMILDNLNDHWDKQEIDRVVEQETRLEDAWEKRITPIIDEMIEGLSDDDDDDEYGE